MIFRASFLWLICPVSSMLFVITVGKSMSAVSAMARITRQGIFFCSAMVAIAVLSMSKAIAPVDWRISFFFRDEETIELLAKSGPV